MFFDKKILLIVLVFLFSQLSLYAGEDSSVQKSNIVYKYSNIPIVNIYAFSQPGLLLLSAHQEFSITGSLAYFIPFFNTENLSSESYNSAPKDIGPKENNWTTYLYNAELFFELTHSGNISPAGISNSSEKSMMTSTGNNNLIYNFYLFPLNRRVDPGTYIPGGGGGPVYINPPINGVCGSANGTTISTIPTANLCTSGSSTSVTGSGPWTWSCTGSNGGSSSPTCTANLTPPPPIPTVSLGATSTSIAYNTSTIISWSSTNATTCTTPFSSTSTSGSFTTPSLTTDTVYTLSCTGSGGTASGSLTITVAPSPPPPSPINGVCGSANGTTISTIPTANLCTSGSSTSVTGSGPWTWSCTGSNGGSSSPTCTANLTPPPPIPTVSLGATSTSIAYNTSTIISWSSTNATTCTTPFSSTSTSGSFTTPSLTTDTVYTLSCTGSGGTASGSLTITVAPSPPPPSPINGVCGSANGTTISTIPTANLCTSGSSTSVTGSGPWTWSCTGSNGGSSSPTCTANLTPPPPIPTVSLGATSTSIAYNTSTIISWSSTNATTCTTPFSSTSTSGSFTTPSLTTDTVYTLSCTGSGGTASGSLTITVAPSPPPPSPINGVCGSANGTTISTIPTANLCTSGSSTSVTGSGPWTWSCTGSNGGSSSPTCTANLTPPPPIPTVSLGATSTSIAYNTSTIISWSSTNATTCTTPFSSTSTSGSFTTPSLTTDTVYTLSCTGSGGTASGSLTITVLPFGSTPTVFWSSYPINPDEIALFRGDSFLATGTTMSIGQIPDGFIGSPLDIVSIPLLGNTLTGISIDNTSASFHIPAGYTRGIYAYTLINTSSGYSPTPSTMHFLNTPDIWFYMADNGMTASPGGSISIYGRSITLSGTIESPSIALVDGSNAVYIITATGASTNNYTATFSLPANIPQGTYALYAHNGHGGSYGWSKFEWHGDTDITTVEIKNPPSWSSVVYSIDNMSGATIDDKVDTAVGFARQNGGGIILFSSGTYIMSRPIILPNRTLLKGMGSGTTTLLWTGTVLDPRSTPMSVCGSDNGNNKYLVSSEYISWQPDGPECATFSIEDMTLGHISSDDYTCIKRAYIPDTERAWFRRMACISPNLATNTISGKGVGMFLARTANTEISDSYFDYRYGINFHGDRSINKFVTVRNNVFRWRMAPYMVTYMNNGMVFEGNQMIMAGTESGNGFTPLTYPDIGEAFGTFSSNIRDIYYGSNTSSREDPSPIPSDSTVDMTFDGTTGAFFGQILSVSGTTIILSGSTVGPDIYNHPPVSTGAIVQIISGKGMGQSRVLRSSPTLTNSILIDQPWDIEPDATSWITIFDYMGRFLMVGNTLANHPRVQFYFPSSDVIFANNTVGVDNRITQLLTWVAPRYNGFSTSMYFQVLDNSISRGGMLYQNVVNALDPHPANYPGHTALSQVFRNNTSSGASFILEPRYDLDQLLLENNIGVSQITFQSPTNSRNMLLRRNITSIGGATPILSIDSPYDIVP